MSQIECDGPRCAKWFDHHNGTCVFVSAGDFCSEDCFADFKIAQACDQPIDGDKYLGKYNTSFCDAVSEGFLHHDGELREFAQAVKEGDKAKAGELVIEAIRAYLSDAFLRQLDRGIE